jgi:hypothetical protein
MKGHFYVSEWRVTLAFDDCQFLKFWGYCKFIISITRISANEEFRRGKMFPPLF